MFWLLTVIFGGGVWLAADWLAFYVALFLAVLLPVGIILIVADWLGGKVGITAAMIHSWQALSGVRTPGQIVADQPDCSNGTGGVILLGFAVFIAGFVLAIGIGIFVVAALIATPIGAYTTVCGVFETLGTAGQKNVLLRSGLGAFTIGVFCVLIAGLGMHLLHGMTAGYAGLYDC